LPLIPPNRRPVAMSAVTDELSDISGIFGLSGEIALFIPQELV